MKHGENEERAFRIRHVKKEVEVCVKVLEMCAFFGSSEIFLLFLFLFSDFLLLDIFFDFLRLVLFIGKYSTENVRDKRPNINKVVGWGISKV